MGFLNDAFNLISLLQNNNEKYYTDSNGRRLSIQEIVDTYNELYAQSQELYAQYTELCNEYEELLDSYNQICDAYDDLIAQQ